MFWITLYIIKDPLEFPSILEENPLKEDEEDISYDVESLFTNVPIDETIEHILDEIYTRKRLKPLCSRLIMKRLLKRLTSDCLFSVNEQLIKQIDGCAMGSPLSVVLSGIFMTKLEKDVVYAESPILYRRFVDDIFNRKKINVEDTLLPKLNSYHHKTKFTVKMKLDKFLDTKMKKSENGQYETSVHRNRKKPMHWTSKVPKKIKRNIITNDLHRAKKISTDFAKEKDIINLKYVNAGYPKRFIESMVRDFTEKQNKPKVEEEQSDQPTVEREEKDQ